MADAYSLGAKIQRNQIARKNGTFKPSDAIGYSSDEKEFAIDEEESVDKYLFFRILELPFTPAVVALFISSIVSFFAPLFLNFQNDELLKCSKNDVPASKPLSSEICFHDSSHIAEVFYKNFILVSVVLIAVLFVIGAVRSKGYLGDRIVMTIIYFLSALCLLGVSLTLGSCINDLIRYKNDVNVADELSSSWVKERYGVDLTSDQISRMQSDAFNPFSNMWHGGDKNNTGLAEKTADGKSVRLHFDENKKNHEYLFTVIDSETMKELPLTDAAKLTKIEEMNKTAKK